MPGKLRAALRTIADLPGYLRRPVRAAEAAARLRGTLAARSSNFLRVLERGVYQHPHSPYLALLRWAGVELGDVRALVARDGVEGALGVLHDAGVFVTLDEVKGRRPIERRGLWLPVAPGAFDNPLLTSHYEGRSSGSRGPRRQVRIGLALLEHEAAYVYHYLDAFDLWRRPYAVWRAVLPAAAGMKWLLRLEKVGKPLDRWFSHTPFELQNGGAAFAAFTMSVIAAGRLLGHRFPMPVHVPGDAPLPVARWLADMTHAGRPAVLDTIASSAVRVCLDARRQGLDISGTLFRTGGEPLTDAKALSISEAGCRALDFYSSTETSLIAAPCAAGPHGDLHLLEDKLAVVTRPKLADTGPVDALVYTTLLPSAPTLLLNVESGDFATIAERSCACTLGRLGFGRHLRQIRSYEKVTSEGVSFLGTELLRVLEEELPRAFGGAPGDYQFVEREEEGVSRVAIVASSRLGALDDAAIVDLVLRTLEAVPGGRMMTAVWRQGCTLGVLRREPYRTESGKILPLHLERTRAPEPPLGEPCARASSSGAASKPLA